MNNANNPPRRSRPQGNAKLPFLLIIAVAIAAGLGFWLGLGRFAGSTDAGIDRSKLKTVSLFPSPLPLQPFSLRGRDDAPVASADLEGRWAMLFFGFTHCPDICPTTLARLGDAAEIWDQSIPAEQRPQVLMVSVDPERDTPARTADYAAYFDKAFLGATGDDAVLQPMARSMGMVYSREPLDSGIEGDYEVQHSASIVLIDPQGRRAGLIRPPLDPAAIAADMVLLVQSGTKLEAAN